MGFDLRFTAVALGWLLLLSAAIAGGVAGILLESGAATLIVTCSAAALGFAGLLRHVQRSNLALARFVEGLKLGDASTRMPGSGGGSFATLAGALNDAARELHRGRMKDEADLRFFEALLDDVPIALLLVETEKVRLANKAARNLFGGDVEGDVARFDRYGPEFVAMLRDPAGLADQVVPLTLAGGVQRALVRRASLSRLGTATGAVMVEPIQQALDQAEVAAQAALVRVLSHEILNSLTPIVSLAGTATVLLGEDPIELDEARLAVLTLARRAEATRRFIDSYREMAKPLEPRRRRFNARDFADEMARLFAIDWIDHKLDCRVDDGVMLDADPDLLSQAVLNLLRNAAQASDSDGLRHVKLHILHRPEGTAIEIADDGHGIPDAIARDIFLPFFTTKAGGSGIGLHLVRQIAVAHGGVIDVATSDANGTTMTLSGL